MKTYCCPDCLLPLRAERQGTKPERINGEIVFTDSMTLVTCDLVICPRFGITREVMAFYAMTDAEVARYNRKAVHHDAR